jgi:integrase
MVRFARTAKELDLEHVNDGLRLAALTGLRREDLVTLTWDEIHQQALVKLAAKVSRGKRRTAVVPRIPALDALLVELRSRHRQEGVNTILVNSYGLAWSADGFGGSFNRVRDAAGTTHTDASTGKVTNKHLHDVRGTFCTKLITVCGLTDQEAASVMAWAPEQVAGIRRTYVDQGAVNMAIAARLRDSL